MDDSLKTLAGRKGAHEMHSRHDSKAVSQPARDASPGSIGYWEREVDPESELEPAERTRRAEHAKKAYFTGLALESAKVRRARKKVS